MTYGQDVLITPSCPDAERIERESIKSGHGDAVGWPIFSRSVFRPGYANASLDATGVFCDSAELLMHVLAEAACVEVGVREFLE